MADVIKDELFFRRSIEAVVVEGRDKDHKVCTQVTDDKLTVPPTSSVYPLLASMRLSGLYFRRPVVKTEAGSSASAVKNSRVGANGAAVNNGKLPLLERISMVYSTIVLILLWVNGIRLLSTFTPQDKTFFAITNKLLIVSWNVQCAVQMTAYFMASRSGRLDRILNDVRLKSAKCNVYTRRMAIRLTSFAWAVAVINFGFYMYTLCFTGGVNDILLAPFGSYVELPDMTPARITFLVYSIYLHVTWCFPVAMTFMLSVIIAHQFRYVSDKLRRSIHDTEGFGISDSDLEEIRQQHGMLCRSVERADKFLRIYHLAAFFGPLVIVILLLYNLIFYWHVFFNTPILAFIYTFWLITGTLQLSVTCAGGIMVNHYAHEITDRLHKINLSTLEPQTIGKVNVFLNRTSAGSIGFTVLGVMVIDRSSVISLLGLLITYFLLVVQLSNPGSSADSSTSTGVNISSTVTTIKY